MAWTFRVRKTQSVWKKRVLPVESSPLLRDFNPETQEKAADFDRHGLWGSTSWNRCVPSQQKLDIRGSSEARANQHKPLFTMPEQLRNLKRLWIQTLKMIFLEITQKPSTQFEEDWITDFEDDFCQFLFWKRGSFRVGTWFASNLSSICRGSWNLPRCRSGRTGRSCAGHVGWKSGWVEHVFFWCETMQPITVFFEASDSLMFTHPRFWSIYLQYQKNTE